MLDDFSWKTDLALSRSIGNCYDDCAAASCGFYRFASSGPHRNRRTDPKLQAIFHLKCGEWGRSSVG